jgi:hypothetical protein
LEKGGEFDFRIISAKVYVEEENKFKLIIKNNTRAFIFMTKNKKDNLEWV